ncbi:4-aminobutyrate--2-oxoglutarate transaminase [Vibrio porteresiae]|uniref:4-aminobutyrate--2-oxoglutarate transaminase n=1 Tax=Vibrio porteresiae DSM 19223 TaxID=1123496 RepID=A0ABZ0QGZ7_9VIBR|nr:4-aminobutyrate--2-oxoglutarate transaminase [Vibrio porteresiae]WPC74731.1 4-aminobutyrate--2-oxoglutarate transaminase [Vibrio porteresiae DSM 19223]
MTNQEWQSRKEKVICKGEANLAPVYAAKAKNATITDIEGNEYIDFSAGIAVVNTGHCHPRIVEAVKAQLENFSHTCSTVVPYTSFVELGEGVVEVAPGDFEKKAAFLTTGSEAVENAIKFARHFTGRPGVIAFKGGFHGRTNMCMGLTGKVNPYKAGFGPFPNNVYHLPYPNAYHGVTEEESLAAFDDLFACDIEPTQIAAIIFEPIQGEGGFYQAPASWVRALRALCDKHGIVMICDEIQSGFARTGRMFACEYYDVVPDLITIAKGLGGGFPISGVVGRADIMDHPQAGGIGGTYAGNAIACTAAVEVLKIIKEEKLVERAQHIGLLFREQLESMQKVIPHIGDIRQVGAMVAIELNDPETGAPLAALTKQLVKECNANGLILLSCGVKGNVIRFLPPLTIESELVVKGLDIVKTQLQALVK